MDLRVVRYRPDEAQWFEDNFFDAAEENARLLTGCMPCLLNARYLAAGYSWPPRRIQS
jgi:hypothetical protein